MLGEPFLDQSLTVLDRDIWGNLDETRTVPSTDRFGYTKVVAGIDWGTHDNHIVISGLRPDGKMDILNLVRVPVTNDYRNIDADINRTIAELNLYEPDLILADLGYNGTKVNRLIQEFGKDKVFGVKVNPSRAVGEIKPSFNKAGNLVTLDKLSGNMFMISQLKSGNIKFWNDSQDKELQTLLNHLKNIMILEEEDDDGNFRKVIKQKNSSQPDHYGQALVYAVAAIRYLLDEDSYKNDFTYMDIDANGMAYGNGFTV